MVSSWTQDDHARSERIANEMLRGVGIEDRQRVDHGMTVLHVRREMTSKERDFVFSTRRGREVSILHEQS